MSFADAQFAYDNMEEPWRDDSLDEEVYEALREEFNENWLCHTELPEKAMAVLTKFAVGEKPNDLEFHVFKTELQHAYEIALEHYSDDKFDEMHKKIVNDRNSI